MFGDARALWAATGLVGIVIGVLQILVPLVQRRDQAMLLWGIGSLMGGIGATLVSFRDHLPVLVTVALANCLLVGARGTFWSGLRSFNRQKIIWPMLFGPPIAVGIACATVPTLRDDPPTRVAVVTVVYLSYTVASIVDGIRADRHEKLVWRRAIVGVLLGWTVLVFLRTIVGFVAPESLDPTTSSANEQFTTVIGLIFVVLNGFNVLLLARERLERELIDAALRDFQTGTLNRAGLYEKSQAIFGRSGRSQVGVLLMDLDEFKSINDRFGHLVGDQVLAAFATIAHNNLPSDGLLARYGGEEFCALLPRSDPNEAQRVAERIREAFELNAVRVDGLLIKATVSIGVATVPAGRGAFDGALADADRALYVAKAMGRNRVVAGSLPWTDDSQNDLLAAD